MANAQFDYYWLILILVIVICGAVMMILDPQKYTMKNPLTTVISGILPLLFAIVFNSAVENRWDIGYILSFVCLKKVSQGHYFRSILAISYIPIFLGGLQILFVRIVKNKQKMIKEIDRQTRIERDQKKEYVNARFESLILQYAIMITTILIVPLGLLYALIGLITNAGYVAVWAMRTIVVVMCAVWLGVAALFLILRKYWVFKIMTTDTDFVAIGFLRKTKTDWNEILSVNIISTGLLFGGKMINVKTKSRNIIFPLTMKEKDKEYPKLDFIEDVWIDSDKEKKPINPENCSLYQEIKKHLKA